MTLSDPKKTKAKAALEKTKQVPSQTRAEIARGVDLRRTSGGHAIARFHYSSLPARDPNITPEWKQKERRTYTSQASWDREQEIRERTSIASVAPSFLAKSSR